MARIGPERAAELVNVRPFAPIEEPGPRDVPPFENEGAPAPPQPARFKSLVQFVGEYVPLDYAIEPIVRTGSLYTLTATTGSGKTAWMITAAYAVATGRRELLGAGIDVQPGRVAFLTFENPDDVRMRLMVAAFLLNIDKGAVTNRIRILDMREKPEAVEAGLRLEAEAEPFRLIFVDTLAAFFDGDDPNSSVQAGEFMRRMRPWTRLRGHPAVVVAAHPVKNAAADNLIPGGSGAVLNEVDGNLTLSRGDGGVIRLHWQGKLRGLEFDAPEFRLEITGSPDVLDAKGRQVHLPTMMPAVATDIEHREKADRDLKVELLRALQNDPTAKQRELALLLKCSLGTINTKIRQLKGDKLIDQTLGMWSLTAKGEKVLGVVAGRVQTD